MACGLGLVSSCCKGKQAFQTLEGVWEVKEINESGFIYTPDPGELVWRFSNCKPKKDEDCNLVIGSLISGIDDESYRVKISCDRKWFLFWNETESKYDSAKIEKLTSTAFVVTGIAYGSAGTWTMEKI